MARVLFACISVYMCLPVLHEPVHLHDVPFYHDVQSYPISSLMRDVEEATHCSLRNYQLHFQEKTLLAVRHGKTLTLRDYRIKKEETLFISKIGFSLDITNPQVSILKVVISHFLL